MEREKNFSLQNRALRPGGVAGAGPRKTDERQGNPGTRRAILRGGYRNFACGRSGALLTIGLIALVLAPALSGCGYRLANRRFDNGIGQTIGVPTFANTTTTYRIEQRLSEAVRRELIQRTRFGVTAESAGDLIIAGQVQGFAQSPILFDDQGRALSYSISVNLKIDVTDTRSGELVLQNDQWTFREVFELPRSSQDFALEDSAAMDRLAKRVASTVVSSLLHASP